MIKVNEVKTIKRTPKRGLITLITASFRQPYRPIIIPQYSAEYCFFFNLYVLDYFVTRWNIVEWIVGTADSADACYLPCLLLYQMITVCFVNAQQSTLQVKVKVKVVYSC